MRSWAGRFATALQNKSPDSRLAVVNFSGDSQDKKQYIAGSGGRSSSGGYFHYKVEVTPGTAVGSAHHGISKMESLDGNSQLWLALQDVSVAPFTNNLKRADRTVNSAGRIITYVYQTELVIVTDDEWDLKSERLRTAQGNAATVQSITNLVHATYDRVSMVVCREKDSDNNLDKINALTKGRGLTYHKVTGDRFDEGLNAATRNLLA